MNIGDGILEYIKTSGQATAKQILERIKAPERTIFHQLAKLTKSGQIVKEGKRPYVSYRLASNVGVGSPDPIVKGGETPPLPIQQSPPPIIQLGPLLFWCNKLGIDPELATKCHNETYEWIFGNSYGLYRIPLGIVGRLMDILLWVLALKLVWIWKLKAVLMPWQRKLLIGVVIVLLVGGVAYHQYSKNHSSKLPASVIVQDSFGDNYQLKVSQEDLKLAKDQIESFSKERSGLTRQIEEAQQEKGRLEEELQKSQDKSRGLETQLNLLKEQVNKSENERKLETGQMKIKESSNQALRQSVAQVTMKDVIDWTKAAVPQATIIQRVKAGFSYKLIPMDVDYLKQNGVSEEVIKAMIDSH